MLLFIINFSVFVISPLFLLDIKIVGMAIRVDFSIQFAI